MLPNPLPQKLIQISEQSLSPVHVPLILGQEFFILTQQDFRKLEDSRTFSLNRLLPNGELKSINAQDFNERFLQQFKQENLLCNQNFNNLSELLNNIRNCQQIIPSSPLQQQFSSNYPPTYPQPMEVSTPMTGCENRTVASIEQQLEWNKCVNTSAPFPPTYSHGTSTTEINYKKPYRLDEKTIKKCCYSKYQQCDINKNLYNKSTITLDSQIVCNKKFTGNLSAREQLKQKKVNFSYL